MAKVLSGYFFVCLIFQEIINTFSQKLFGCLHAIWMAKGILTTRIYADNQHFKQSIENK
jgi:hypothetical protein